MYGSRDIFGIKRVLSVWFTYSWFLQDPYGGGSQNLKGYLGCEKFSTIVCFRAIRCKWPRYQTTKHAPFWDQICYSSPPISPLLFSDLPFPTPPTSSTDSPVLATSRRMLFGWSIQKLKHNMDLSRIPWPHVGQHYVIIHLLWETLSHGMFTMMSCT